MKAKELMKILKKHPEAIVVMRSYSGSKELLMSVVDVRLHERGSYAQDIGTAPASGGRLDCDAIELMDYM